MMQHAYLSGLILAVLNHTSRAWGPEPHLGRFQNRGNCRSKDLATQNFLENFHNVKPIVKKKCFKSIFINVYHVIKEVEWNCLNKITSNHILETVNDKENIHPHPLLWPVSVCILTYLEVYNNVWMWLKAWIKLGIFVKNWYIMANKILCKKNLDPIAFK
jgi:hypothetical protein